MKAIIYLPGLGISIESQPVESIGHRIRNAIDINHDDPTKKFKIETRKETYGYEQKLEATTVRISEGDQDGILDIFEYSYAKELTERFENQNVIMKTFTLCISLILNVGKIIKGLYSGKGLNTRGKIQTIYVLFVLGLLTIFGVFLISSIPLFFAQTFHLEDSKELSYFLYKTSFGYCLRSNFNWLTSNLNFVVGLMASFFLLFPNLKNTITNLATEFICLINYFNYGDRNLSLVGKFDELLEHISEHENKYSEVIIVSYSFGSAIAMDVLFPPSKNCSERIRQKISTLITIGCPYDFIRFYWDKYYENRISACANLNYWFNVCSPSDILSSNFRDDSKAEDGNKPIIKGGIPPHNVFFNVMPSLKLNTMNILMLVGIRAHRMYWDEGRNSSSCFTNLLQEMKAKGYSLI
jgi:hypothetical protein